MGEGLIQSLWGRLLLLHLSPYIEGSMLGEQRTGRAQGKGDLRRIPRRVEPAMGEERLFIITIE